MKDGGIYEIAKLWLPEEHRGIVKVSTFANDNDEVFLHFDNDYSLHVSKEALLSLKSLLNECIDALDALEAFDKFQSDLNKPDNLDNVLQFKRRDDD